MCVCVCVGGGGDTNMSAGEVKLAREPRETSPWRLTGSASH